MMQQQYRTISNCGAMALEVGGNRQPDSPTARQPDSPTARQPDSPTARQPDSPTARQPDSPTLYNTIK